MKTKHPLLRENANKLRRISRMMKTIGNESRLAIIELLIDRGRLPVREISEVIDISQSSTSQHLKALENVGAIGSEREGTSIYYSIENTGMEKLLACMHTCADC
ncbi:metalloregulator ArsR/SmtB family transcription factor [bacterium]|nr:metalloregulator ArsR/SmtB family transcription factor [bacterium]